MEYLEKVAKLKEILTSMESVVIAFSGGVDSSLVLATAIEVLGRENVLSVVADSELIMKSEYLDAVKNSEKIGAQTKGIFLDELSVKEIQTNQPSSWFYSKRLLYQELTNLKNTLGFNWVVDGMIMDDAFDYRPGLKARDAFGVRSPLQEAEFYKPDVRRASKGYDLPTWNKPATCHVLSRFEYNERLTSERVERVKKSEIYLQELGFKIVRVRDHRTVARIEIEKEKFPEFLAQAKTIEEKLLSFGYTFVSLDVRGYTYGKMNKLLEKK
ncbi:PP-loop superfamily ATP-binding protein [Enterococcus saigonensis]|uniref:PP-loop superfamily ATP-binding protein n=1 Tax=Enterococcus saigonensis TaxID=1805431 RepID=A0A679IBG3_9ENTE|nr:ATP-dependent sacrificial sulfur transferase LarE [Enterococcus saigonensis]BCA87028.1 PP-loop superfamily ATP-binding protein [Enterococcus saigonensis]